MGALCLGMVLAAAMTCGDVQPLTDRHWQDAPATVLERETGIPASVIEGQRRRRDRDRDPYPSIPGTAGQRTPVPRE